MKQSGEATVVKHTGSHYLLSALPEWDPFPAVIRGRVRLSGSASTNPVAVGDRVHYSLEGASSESIATIDEILPRANCVVRRSTNLSRENHIIAANLDRALLVVTMAFPQVKPEFIDRFLVTCRAYGVPVTIVINKTDIEDPSISEARDAFESIYGKAGYRIIETSAKTGEGIEELRAALAVNGRGEYGVNLLSGVSGVGKSSIVKALDPSLNPRTAQISLSHLQGRHTTTFYEMYPLCSGGFIIDTPGIRSFGLLDLEPEEIALYFPEMLKASSLCRFTPCTHTHEPFCAVKAAVDAGEISAERYNSYLGMLEENTKYRTK